MHRLHLLTVYGQVEYDDMMVTYLEYLKTNVVMLDVAFNKRLIRISWVNAFKLHIPWHSTYAAFADRDSTRRNNIDDNQFDFQFKVTTDYQFQRTR